MARKAEHVVWLWRPSCCAWRIAPHAPLLPVACPLAAGEHVTDSFAFLVSGGFVSARGGPLQALRAVAVFLQGVVFASPVVAQSGERLVKVVAILLVPFVGGFHDAQ